MKKRLFFRYSWIRVQFYLFIWITLIRIGHYNSHENCHNAKQLNDSKTSVSDYLCILYIQKVPFWLFFWCEMSFLDRFHVIHRMIVFLFAKYSEVLKRQNWRKWFERERGRKRSFPKLLGGWDDPVNTNVHAYAHTHTHTHTHTYTHTHTPRLCRRKGFTPTPLHSINP